MHPILKPLFTVTKVEDAYILILFILGLFVFMYLVIIFIVLHVILTNKLSSNMTPIHFSWPLKVNIYFFKS